MDLTPPQPMHTDDPTAQADEFFSNANFLVSKMTDYCNLACTYCHQDALTGKPVLMPTETFKNAVRLILKPSTAPVVYVQFHGGEPLLMPDEFFYEVVAFCKKELETPTRRVEFCIQTNLTRVFKGKEKMLKELKIGISFSMDGPPEINDDMRGGGRRIQENWRRMQKNGTGAGMICLIQPTNWDRMDEVIDYFDKEGMHHMRFNLMVPDGRGKDHQTAGAEKLFNAKKVVLDYMLRTKGERLNDVTLTTAMKKFVKPTGAPSSFEYHGCESLYCPAAQSLFSINPDGTFYACDRIAEVPSWSMGNVNRDFGNQEKALATKKRRDFHVKDDWWARCEGCDAKKICEFSCSAYYVDKVDTREIECQYTKKMWSHFMERKEEIFEFMKRDVKPVFIDEKVPLAIEDKEKRSIRDLAADASFNDLSLVDTLALNKNYQLFKRGEQFYLFLFKRNKIFEVDEMVADIACFNGCVSPNIIEQGLKAKFEPGKLAKTLNAIMEQIPEILLNAKLPVGLSELQAAPEEVV